MTQTGSNLVRTFIFRLNYFDSIFEKVEIRMAMFKAGLIESIRFKDRVFSITGNAAGTDEKPIDGWTFLFDDKIPYELLEIKKVRERPGGCDDHIRDVIKTVGWDN